MIYFIALVGFAAIPSCYIHSKNNTAVSYYVSAKELVITALDAKEVHYSCDGIDIHGTPRQQVGLERF